MYVKNAARGHKVEKRHPEGKNVPGTRYDGLSIQRKTVMVHKYSEKVTSSKKQKREETETKKDADSSGKQNKTDFSLKLNITPEKDNTTSAWRIQVRATCG